LVYRIWRGLKLKYVQFAPAEVVELEALSKIPREDLEIYLTARVGQTELFVSSNHELVRAMAAATGAFESCTPGEFVERFQLA
jgi:hypothetical protein